MHTPTVLSVTDLDTAPRVSTRADVRDISRAETLRDPRAARPANRTAPITHFALAKAPSNLLTALGGIALAVIMLVIWHVLSASFASDDLIRFAAPTAFETEARSIEALVAGAR